MNLALNLAVFFYFIGLIFYSLKAVAKKGVFTTLARLSLIFGLISNAVCLVARWKIAGFMPLTNMFESMAFFGLVITAVYLIYDFVYKVEYIGIVASSLALLALGYASFSDTSIRPLIPALQSNWLTIHVITIFIGYAGFATSFSASIVYLILKNDSSDLVAYKSVMLGVLFLTIGVITGAVWANKAWGSYWSWDPKETWALITWFIYAVYVHLRIMRGVKGKLAAYLSILGFLAVIFTYLGVNFLLSGLHSYA